MAPTSHRIAQTSSEAKKQHKKNGSQLPARQQKQLERAHELDQRANRLREAEQRRKAALKKRKEREEKEKAARKQIGVGLATQLVGYSHTQAQLKNGMEAFLGVTKRKDEERKKREAELTRQLEVIADTVEKEPWDDDDDVDRTNLPEPAAKTVSQDIDDDLDDDTFHAIHDLMTSEANHDSSGRPQPQPVQERIAESSFAEPQSSKGDLNFVRLHGPINRAIEKLLDHLPEPLIELLSIDLSMRLPQWDPSAGLLHKLNPVGFPPHRLRLKVGSVVVLLRDLNASSQLSKSQHLRVLRVESERIECVVLDGQLEGTKTLITRVPFFAKYRNDDQFLFKRTQFPVKIATDYAQSGLPPRQSSTIGFKPPSLTSKVNQLRGCKISVRQPPSSETQPNVSSKFKIPSLPASKSTSNQKTTSTILNQRVSSFSETIDEWDDFLESATQIARELSPIATKPNLAPHIQHQICSVEGLPPFSTQDFEFSMEDLDEVELLPAGLVQNKPSKKPCQAATILTSAQGRLPSFRQNGSAPLPLIRKPEFAGHATSPITPFPPRQSSSHGSNLLDLTTLRASQKPPSVSDRPGLKRKARAPLPKPQSSSSKRNCNQTSNCIRTHTQTVERAFNHFGHLGVSTQDLVSSFPDDDELSFGSPPIAV